MKIRDEVEIWADGYGFVEFQRTGTGLVPYHHESRPGETAQPIEMTMPLGPADSLDTGAAGILLA
jgi:hypothetical protein